MNDSGRYIKLPPLSEEPPMSQHKFDCPSCKRKDVPIRVDGRMAEHRRFAGFSKGRRCHRSGTLPVSIFEHSGVHGFAKAVADAIREVRDGK